MTQTTSYSCSKHACTINLATITLSFLPETLKQGVSSAKVYTTDKIWLLLRPVCTTSSCDNPLKIRGKGRNSPFIYPPRSFIFSILWVIFDLCDQEGANNADTICTCKVLIWCDECVVKRVHCMYSYTALCVLCYSCVLIWPLWTVFMQSFIGCVCGHFRETWFWWQMSLTMVG